MTIAEKIKRMLGLKKELPDNRKYIIPFRPDFRGICSETAERNKRLRERMMWKNPWKLIGEELRLRVAEHENDLPMSIVEVFTEFANYYLPLEKINPPSLKVAYPETGITPERMFDVALGAMFSPSTGVHEDAKAISLIFKAYQMERMQTEQMISLLKNFLKESLDSKFGLNEFTACTAEDLCGLKRGTLINGLRCQRTVRFYC